MINENIRDFLIGLVGEGETSCEIWNRIIEGEGDLVMIVEPSLGEIEGTFEVWEIKTQTLIFGGVGEVSYPWVGVREVDDLPALSHPGPASTPGWR